MPGKRPHFRLFLSDENGEMPKDESGYNVEFLALWETRRPDKRGNPMYSGKTGKGEQYGLLVQVPPPNEQQFNDSVPDEEKPW